MASYADLQAKVANSKSCPDPWTGEAFYAVYSRQPSAKECNASNFGGGHWTTYSDLVSKVQAYKQSGSAPPASVASPATAVPTSALLKAPTAADLISDAGGNLHDSSGKIVYPAGSYIIGENSSGIVGFNGSGIISQDGNGLKPGDIIQGGAAGFHTMSADGKTTIKGTIVRKK